ncbi:hypothetical protein SAMN06297129_2075 [Pseudooceanicola antarcticus]|uniref:Uncharacterized protein n=1 Tax=Pseudooceanicola antarcticus TaxID=1247613 RepID=A0A285ITG8_9RHOB|nr:hypothetical protein [Pseudooceanicola antarcticus]PJE32023.1 hypothetical protein CVM39_02705 [Pseudooceanicola antarcticus]SNY51282.1 hypothetical protein SAMN06297129_2075 [Pseudooceanicola antarcticus]
MSDPVTNIQIEDVLASIRRLVSEEVRAQTQGETDEPPAADPAPEAKAEKLILAPHLRVAGSDEPADEARIAGEAMQDAPAEDPFAEAPFTEVTAEEAAAFQEDAEIFHGFGTTAPQDEAGAEVSAADPFAFETTPEIVDEIEDEVQDAAPLNDFDAVLRSLEMGAAEPEDEDFASYGDGAAEALASAHHGVTDDWASDDSADEAPEAEEARFDDLDAVLSSLNFDPEPKVSASARVARAEIEDAEILDGEAESDSEERMYLSPEAPAPEESPEADLHEETAGAGEESPLYAGQTHAAPTSGEAQDPLPEEPEEILSFEDELAPSEEDAATGEEPEGLLLDEQILRDMVSEIVRQELQGALGERITRNVRKLVRREIQRALQSQDYI